MAAEVKRGPRAVIECHEEIPCNPCQSACARHAIAMEGGINGLPQVIEERCTGCCLCIPHCSGQAIFVVDDSYSDTEGLVSIPYEFVPLPAVGQKVQLTDRMGLVVAEGQIHRVLNPPAFDHTAVVTMRVPLGLTDIVRGFKPMV